MRSISTKLFFSLLGLTSLVLIATVGLARWSFEYGFTDYIRSLEQNRLARIAEEMSTHYVENGGSWDSSTASFFKQAHRAGLPSNGRRLSPRGADSVGPPPGVEEPAAMHRRAPPPGSNRGGFNDSPPPPGMGGPDPGGRNPGRNRGPAHPTALFDQDNRQIAGNYLPRAPDRIVMVPVMVGETRVGELRTVVQRGFNNPIEQAFSAQQKWASLIIAGLCLLLAALASWLLARMLLAPVMKMKSGLMNLVQGDYSQRLTEPQSVGQPGLQMQDELAALMTDIDQLAGTLEQNRRARKRWLADISHELRTPVTVLSGEIEAIRDGLRPLDMHQLESIGYEVDRLKHLIHDLYELSLSDIGGLRYEFAALNISDSLQSMLQRYESRFQASGLRVEQNIEPGIVMNGDINRLEQLFNNLILNSLSYTDAPGTMVIRLIEKSEKILVIFEDSAPGVNLDELELLFEPLYREDKSRSRSSAGAGLGLTICRNIVNAHKGTIELRHSELGGLQIRISFPGMPRKNG